MSAEVSLAGRAGWLGEKHLQRLLAALKEGGEEARVAGGAVRNALIGQPVADIDIAATTVPEETIRRAEAAGFKTVPTGIEHGTITVVAGGKVYEVTTLRADIETDGRRAKVTFGRDWQLDAERRDFTINALYAEADGTVVDLVGGVADIEARRLRFIGDPEARIREDYLRILRFFRFFAWYGDGRPDAEGLKACARLKDGLGRLSAERVWSELKKLFSAPDPSRALLWMRQAGVLSAVLPESEKWGIDAIHGLVRTEKDLGWAADPMLRLEAIVPPDAARMKMLAERLRFSNGEGQRLRCWALTVPPDSKATETEFSKKLYFGDCDGFLDRLRLALAAARGRAIEDNQAMMEAGGYSRLLNFALKWERPVFPIKGADLTGLGASPGPKLGATLKNLEREWVDSGFTMDRGALLKRAAKALEA
ncbi:CCA tRNA nucleotidyltransferase [Mesorhizobium sp. VK24D]|uniref:CCA tRNA nucleotidyltransferase n=1 Tax=Mesorhizobium album TaxID=3072314 RepID=A0ABU4YA55_9HYPH|nr:CCA tRNA nucleotidyltransferase [Mesorhizobium sp. VK24D]MDX8482990.1 CCA tRNA nucleotidyltransferase [Mesorhizobium sp. VK24D]